MASLREQPSVLDDEAAFLRACAQCALPCALGITCSIVGLVLFLLSLLRLLAR